MRFRSTMFSSLKFSHRFRSVLRHKPQYRFISLLKNKAEKPAEPPSQTEETQLHVLKGYEAVKKEGVWTIRKKSEESTTFRIFNFATTSIVFLLLGFYGFFEYIYNRPKTEKFEVLIEVE